MSNELPIKPAPREAQVSESEDVGATLSHRLSYLCDFGWVPRFLWVFACEIVLVFFASLDSWTNIYRECSKWCSHKQIYDIISLWEAWGGWGIQEEEDLSLELYSAAQRVPLPWVQLPESRSPAVSVGADSWTIHSPGWSQPHLLLPVQREQ